MNTTPAPYTLYTYYTNPRHRAYGLILRTPPDQAWRCRIQIAPHPANAYVVINWNSGLSRRARDYAELSKQEDTLTRMFDVSIHYRDARPKVTTYHAEFLQGNWHPPVADAEPDFVPPTNLLEFGRLLSPRKPLPPEIVLGWWEDQESPWCYVASDPVEWVNRLAKFPALRVYW